MAWESGPRDEREGLFGGRGRVTVHDRFAGRAHGPFQAALMCALDPGGFVGRHRQERFDELVIVVSGHGHATVGTTQVALEAGEIIHLPLGQSLSLQNGSTDELLRYLIVKA